MKRKFLCLLLALTMVLGLAANVSAEPEVITSGDWSYMIYDGMAQLRYYEGSDPVVTVPAEIDGYKVYSIGWGLTCPFAGVRDVLTDVVISEGVQMVERQCFKDCTKLKSVTLPSTLAQIGTYSFQNCTALKEIELNEGLLGVAHYAFLNTGLTSVYIPATVTFIGDEAFGYEGPMEDTQSMDSFTIYGYTGTAAHEYAQYYRFITFVDMGGNYDNSGSCGYGAFWEFTAATGTLHIDVVGDDTAPMFEYEEPEEIPWFVHMPFISNVVVEDVLDIANYAFQGCANLTTVTMTDSVKYIRSCTFMDTPKLASVKLSANLESIDSYAFCNTSLASIDLPEGLRSIGSEAFCNTPLTSIEIPDSVTFLGQGAFHGCTKLSSVKLPAELDEIYPQLFEGCTSLKTIDLPENLIVIGRQAFSGSGLTSIEIPSSVAAIDYRAFAQCENLKYLNLPADLVELYGSCFIDCPNLSAIAFRSDAPYFYDNTFQDTTVTCYYPADNATWTEEVLQNYGGTVTWLPYEVLPFTDVPVNTFYYAPVDWAVDSGVTNGATETTFNPDGQCQRGQIVTFLWRAAGCPVVEAENPFTDVTETDFYYDAVLWAVRNGITTGTSETTFSPFKVCTRAEVVTFLWRAAGKPASVVSNPFSDVNSTDFFHTAVLWAVEQGITNGMDATHFAPYSICNRAQVVTFLYRAKDLIKAEPNPRYSFELRSNDPAEEIGFVFCEGTEFAAGETVTFYAEPWFGYLVEFSAEPSGELELYYMGAYTYELVMPAHDVVLTANFVSAPGEPHTITTDCENGFAVAVCDTDDDLNAFAKAGEFIQFLIVPEEGYGFSPEGFTVTANGQPYEEWWYLGELVEEDPELGTIEGIFVVEMLMPDTDVSVSVTCTPGTSPAAAEIRIGVAIR